MAKPMKLNVEQILKRHQIAQTRKENFRDLYEDAYELRCLSVTCMTVTMKAR